jgi:hypothetical protein
MKEKWVRKDGDLLKRSVDSVVDEAATQLLRIGERNGAYDAITEGEAKTLKKRQLISQAGSSLWMRCASLQAFSFT